MFSTATGTATLSAGMRKSSEKPQCTKQVNCPKVFTPSPGSCTYRRGDLLGRGAFAAVFAVRESATGKEYAAKCVDKRRVSASDRSKVHEEARIMAVLRQHSCIVQLFRASEDDSFIYLLIERCRKRTLADVHKVRGPLPLQEAVPLLQQVTRAVGFMHSHLIMHRDLKLSNVFFCADCSGTGTGAVKVGDFGLACQLSHLYERKRHVLGTPNYIAPEVLHGKRGRGHGLEVDVWAIGVITFTTLVGFAPFQSADVDSTHERIKQCDWAFPQTSSCSVTLPEHAKAFIRACLQHEPQKRPRASKLLHFSFLTSSLVERENGVEQQESSPYSESLSSKQADVAAGEDEHGALAIKHEIHNHGAAVDQNDDEKENIPVYSSEAKLHHPAEMNTSNASQVKQAAADEAATTKSYAQADDVPTASVSPTTSPAEATGDCTRHASNEIAALSEQLPDSFPLLWVTRWLDLTAKYGIGYVLCNGTVGACFNDGTRAVLEPNRGTIEHHDRSTSYKQNVQQQNTVSRFEGGELPENVSRNMCKKKKLLYHFKLHLLDAPAASTRIERAGAGRHGGCFAREEACKSETGSMSFVYEWFRAENATVFRLSTRSVHVVFHDGCELILSSDCDTVVYRPPTGRTAEHEHVVTPQVQPLQVHSLSDIPSSGQAQVHNRLQQAKVFLYSTIGASQPQAYKPSDERRANAGRAAVSYRDDRSIKSNTSGQNRTLKAATLRF